jgi:hypothetical protein
VRIREPRHSAEDLDVVPFHVGSHDRPFHLHHVLLATHEVRNGETFLEGIVDSVEAALPQSGKIQCCLTQSLGRHGPRVNPSSPEVLRPLDQGNPLPEVSSLSRPLFSRRPGTDYDQVKPPAHPLPPAKLEGESTGVSARQEPARSITSGATRAAECVRRSAGSEAVSSSARRVAGKVGSSMDPPPSRQHRGRPKHPAAALLPL